MRTSKSKKSLVTMAFAALLVVLPLACSQQSTGPEGGSESEIVVSNKMPEGDTAPKGGVLDTLIYLSHVQLVASTCYTDSSDPHYPEIIFVANDVVKTFAFVWLPQNWNTFPDQDKRMIVHLHGHCGIGTKHFCKWYELARSKNIAVLSLQYWMGEDEWCGGNPKLEGDYSYYLTGPGETCGWHLNIETDIYPFIDKLMEYYDVHSVMLHGFSMAAATSAIVDYRDKHNRDIIDFTVFDAGHIDSTHYFYEEIRASSDPKPFAGEDYYFFLEDIDPDTYTKQAATRAFLIDKGATDIETVTAVDSDYKHGALLNHDDFLSVRERIVALYDSLSAS